ncbi:conserved hypothetical protein [delta proteobacterium NaphS2]|nr:conserved hypothetical protein [delta proteobacterium NaphS2]
MRGFFLFGAGFVNFFLFGALPLVSAFFCGFFRAKLWRLGFKGRRC